MTVRLSADARQWVDQIFGHYITGMINDGDEERAKREILDVIRAEVASSAPRSPRENLKIGPETRPSVDQHLLNLYRRSSHAVHRTPG